MQKERNMSEYIDFITYQDDAIIQRPLRYYRITEEEDNRIHNRREAFIRETGSEKYDFLKKFGYLTYSLYLCRQLQY